MVKKIFDILFSDIQWKLISLFAALILWFLAMNINDPQQNHMIVTRLTLANLEILSSERIMLLNEDDLNINIQVGIRGSRSNIENYLSNQDFVNELINAVIDFRAIDFNAVHAADGVHIQQLRVSPNIDPMFEHVTISPGYIEVHLDARLSESSAVDVESYGLVTHNHALQPVELTNNRITITGPRSIVQSIDRVVARVNVIGIIGEENIPVNIQVFNANGEDITNFLILSVTETTARIRVWEIRPVEVYVESVGEPASGFAKANWIANPNIVYVAASEDNHEHLEKITISVDLNNARSDQVFNINLSEWLPIGVILPNEEPVEVEVLVYVEPIEVVNLSIPRGDVRIRGVTALYQVLGDASPIQISVSGPRSIVQNITQADVQLELDLRNLQIAIHTVPLGYTLPQGVSLASNIPTMMVQIHSPARLELEGDDEDEEPSFVIPPQPPPQEISPPITEESSPSDEDEYQNGEENILEDENIEPNEEIEYDEYEPEYDEEW